MPSRAQYAKTEKLATAATLRTMAFEAFFYLPFFGRLRWLLFGAKTPQRQPTLREVTQAEKAKREAAAAPRTGDVTNVCDPAPVIRDRGRPW